MEAAYVFVFAGQEHMFMLHFAQKVPDGWGGSFHWNLTVRDEEVEVELNWQEAEEEEGGGGISKNSYVYQYEGIYSHQSGVPLCPPLQPWESLSKVWMPLSRISND